MKINKSCLKKAAGYCIALMIQIFFISMTSGQDRKGVDLQIDNVLVNQNIWRGCYQSGASIQPSVSVMFGNFDFLIWGTTDFQNRQKEIDLSIFYYVGNFSVGITDYWGGIIEKVYAERHFWEGTISYNFKKVPLTIQWNTVFGGEESPYNFSSYFEGGYDLSWKLFDFSFCIGISPWENQLLENEGFAITQLSAEVQKKFTLKDNLNLIWHNVFTYNPHFDQMFWITGIRVSFTAK